MTADTPRGATTITTDDGCRLAVVDTGGPGRPALLLHAWGLDSRMWEPLVPRLRRAGLRPVLVDRRGHGRSDRPADGYDLDALAGDVERVVSALDLRDVLLVGHSFGGTEAVRVAARDTGGRISGLVLSATPGPCLQQSPTNPTGIPSAVFDAVRAQMEADIAGWIVDNTEGYWGSEHHDRPVELVWTQQALFSTPLRVLLAVNEAMTSADLRDDLASIEVPTLVLHGDADRSVPLEATGRFTAALLPHGRLVVVPGAGHGMYASFADEWLAAVVAHAGVVPAPI